MAIFDPSKYEDNSGLNVDYTAPAGPYELYFTDMSIKTTTWGEKMLGGKLWFADGPRAGKYFYHNFRIFQDDDEKKGKHLQWFANFCLSIGVGPLDPELDYDQLNNMPFIGDVDLLEKNGKKYNSLKPWAFHPCGKVAAGNDVKKGPLPSSVKSSAVSSIRLHEDDRPF